MQYVYGLVGLLIVGLGLGAHYEYNRAERLNLAFSDYKAQQAQAVADQQAQQAKDAAAQVQREREAGVQHDKDASDHKRLVDHLSSQLRGLQALIDSRLVPGAVADQGGVQAGSASAGENGGTGPPADTLAGAVQAAASACLRTYDDWQAIIRSQPPP